MVGQGEDAATLSPLQRNRSGLPQRVVEPGALGSPGFPGTLRRFLWRRRVGLLIGILVGVLPHLLIGSTPDLFEAFGFGFGGLFRPPPSQPTGLFLDRLSLELA